MSDLLLLAHFGHPGVGNVRIPFGARCAGLALYPFYKTEQANSRAVIGLTDISARYYLCQPLGMDILSFNVLWNLFKEMEGNVPES